MLKSASELLAASDTVAASDKNDIFTQVTAYVTAPVLFCYVRDLLIKAQSMGLRRIYFLARDGYIMNKIACELCIKMSLDIECRYLYCSRFSLRNALYYLCESADDFESTGIFGRCARQSAYNTLSRAGLDGEQRRLIYEDVGFDGDEYRMLCNAEFDCFADKLRHSALFLDTLKQHSKKNYDMITAYFEQEGLFDTIPFALADTGWLGSIQTALMRLVKDRITVEDIKGFYFGLFRGLDGDKFIPFLFSGENAHKYVPRFCNNLFECFCAAPHGMTVGYESKNGKISPIFKEQNAEFAAAARKQTDMVTAFTKAVCAGTIPDMSRELSKKIVQKLLFALMYKPDRDEAETMGCFPFCDDATEQALEPLAEKCDTKSLKGILFINRFINRAKGRSVYPSKGVYWLYGTIVLSDCKPKWAYRLSVRMWEKVRLLAEKK